MPTQDEFLEAALRFEEAAEDLTYATRFVSVVWSFNPGSVGGALTASIDEFMDRLRADGVALGDRLLFVAEKCRERASAVAATAAEWVVYNAAFDQYAVDWSDWDVTGQIGDPPLPPQAPYTQHWMDLGGLDLGAPSSLTGGV